MEGEFGVFDSGALYAVWKDAQNEALGLVLLGPVSPLKPVSVQRVLPPPDAAHSIELMVVADVDQSPHILAQAVFG
jgi:hypothetical protein